MVIAPVLRYNIHYKVSARGGWIYSYIKKAHTGTPSMACQTHSNSRHTDTQYLFQSARRKNVDKKENKVPLSVKQSVTKE